MYGLLICLSAVLPRSPTHYSPMTDSEAWNEYCEASLDLSNQEDVGEEQEVDECGYPLKLGDFYAS